MIITEVSNYQVIFEGCKSLPAGELVDYPGSEKLKAQSKRARFAKGANHAASG
jgi:hypothetical protein